MPQKCALIYLNYGPYHIARVNALAELMPEMHAIEIASRQGNYPWTKNKTNANVHFHTLFQEMDCLDISAYQQCKAVRKELDKIKPSAVIVAGYAEPVMRAAAKWANERKIPIILLFVSTYQDNPRKFWKELLKRKLINNYSAIAVTSQRARQYALKLKAPNEKLFLIGNVVDNNYFQKKAQKIRSENPSRLRKKYKLPENYFLCVSRLSPEKNIQSLLHAFKSYKQNLGRWSLVIVGSGPQKQELHTMRKDFAIDSVHFIDWQSYEKLPLYYTLAKCFVLPSLSEPWGLVVNEAMACGLPVLVSDKCGCLPELCKDGLNGFSFDPNDSTDLTHKMHVIAENPEELHLKNQMSQKTIESFTPKTWAENLYSCTNSTLMQNYKK